MGCKTVFGKGYKDIWCVGILTSEHLTDFEQYSWP